MDVIYLDYNATTPARPEVLEEMQPFLEREFGNPSSAHAYGREPVKAVALAREQLAGLLGCDPEEIVFTGCGSESDNLALKGIAEARRHRGNHLITSAIEHPAVLLTCHYLEKHGFEVTYLPVDEFGRVHPEQVAEAITDRTILVSIMHASNETGSIQPIREIGEIARSRGLCFHTDAAQSVGKIPTHVDSLGVDLLTVAGHKLYAPKGVGALYVRRGTDLEPLIHGGGQEHGVRAGTENVALIVALGWAAALAGEELEETQSRVRALRDRLHAALEASPGGIQLNGHPTERLPNTLNVSFEGIESTELLAAVPEIAASTGSACHAGGSDPSPVLTAMGLPREVALGAVRFSVGRYTTDSDIDRAVALIAEKAQGLRGERSARTQLKTGGLPEHISLADLDAEEIQGAVREAYSQVADEPEGRFLFPVGLAFAESLGYPADVLSRLPSSLSASFTGAGNPHPVVDVAPGETLLDLGCGAGLDLWFYAQKIGPAGRLYGLDFSPAMLEAARAGLHDAGVENVTFLLAGAEQIPLDDESVDIVTSNGIYNLSPDKTAVFREVHRVLRPGGRTVLSEIVLRDPPKEPSAGELRDWFRCIGGALTLEHFLRLMEQAGLANAEVLDIRRNARTGQEDAVCATIRATRIG